MNPLAIMELYSSVGFLYVHCYVFLGLTLTAFGASNLTTLHSSRHYATFAELFIKDLVLYNTNIQIGVVTEWIVFRSAIWVC